MGNSKSKDEIGITNAPTFGAFNNTFSLSQNFNVLPASCPSSGYDQGAGIFNVGGGTIDYSRLVVPSDFQGTELVSNITSSNSGAAISALNRYINSGIIKNISWQINASTTNCGSTLSAYSITSFLINFVNGQNTGWLTNDRNGFSGKGTQKAFNNNYTSTQGGLPNTTLPSGFAWGNSNDWPPTGGQLGLAGGSVNITLSFQVDMRNYCNGITFESNICKNYCREEDAGTDCIFNVKNYCFNNSGDFFSEPIFDPEGHCQIFLQNYFSKPNQGGDGDVDGLIKKVCSDNNINPSNYYGDLNKRNLCACHFEDVVYDNYYQTLVTKIPGLQFGQTSARCLFPGCSIAKFKSVEILGENRCPAIQCIQGVNLTVTGKLDSDNIEINQDANCTKFISDAGGKKCTANSDCPNNTVCTNSVCTTFVPVACNSNDDCPTNYVCNLSKKSCEFNSSSPKQTNNNMIIIIIAVVVFIILALGLLAIIIFRNKSK
jgi:hypothetical protein